MVRDRNGPVKRARLEERCGRRPGENPVSQAVRGIVAPACGGDGKWRVGLT